MKKRALISILVASSCLMMHAGQENLPGARVPQRRFVRNDQGQLMQVVWVDGIVNPIYIMPMPANALVVPYHNPQADQDAGEGIGGLVCTIQ